MKNSEAIKISPTAMQRLLELTEPKRSKPSSTPVELAWAAAMRDIQEQIKWQFTSV